MANLFDLEAKLTLDSSEYESGLNQAEGKASSFGGKISSGLGSAVKTAAQVGTAAVGAAAAGISAIVKQSTDAYANYEQLSGGIETLFGQSANKVMADSQAAFQTAGMSMNQYMETSIQSAAAMINSLGGDQAQAAEKMNMSITDMADNVNKMGTTMESVQDAYRGFSRGNFTMLDNLALGFAGTKEGMQSLLDKAQEISGVEYDISSYADIVDAIHVVQTEMGITGTTAKEASSTIQGSLGATKAAWENLMTGLADPNADVGKLVDNLISSAGTALGNLLPVVEQALSGIGDAVVQMAPALGNAISELATTVLPQLVQSAVSLIQTLGSTLISNAPSLINSAIAIIQTLITGLADMAPMLTAGAVQIIVELAQALTDPGNLSSILNGAVSIIQGLADGLLQSLPTLISAIPTIVDNIVTFFTQNAPSLIVAGAQLLIQLAVGLIQAIPELLSALPEIVSSLAQGLIDLAPNLLEAGKELAKSAWEGIKSIFGKGGDKADASENVDFSGVESKAQSAANTVTSSFASITQSADLSGLKTNAETSFAGISTAADTTKTDVVQKFGTMGTDISAALAETASAVDWSPISDGAEEAADNTVDAFKPVPDEMKADWESIKKTYNEVPSWFQKTFNAAKQNIMAIWQTLPPEMEAVWVQIKGIYEEAPSWFEGKAEEIITAITGKFTTFIADTENGPYAWGKALADQFAAGVSANAVKVKASIEASFSAQTSEGGGSGTSGGGSSKSGLLTKNPVQTSLSTSLSSTAKATDTSNDKLDTVIQMLNSYLPGIANRDVVLDSGATVGALLPKINSGLGTSYAYDMRGNA